MDPLSAAGALATLVGLIGQYKSSRDAEAGKDFESFLTWLIQSGQNDLKSAIESNHTTAVSIKALLNVQRSDFVERLERIETALAGFASSVDGFETIAQASRPNAVLSEQALNILRFYETSKSGKLLELKVSGGVLLMSLDGGGNYAPEDQRFVQDDLDALQVLGLLSVSLNSKGGRIFNFTRRAHHLVTASQV